MICTFVGMGKRDKQRQSYNIVSFLITRQIEYSLRYNLTTASFRDLFNIVDTYNKYKKGSSMFSLLVNTCGTSYKALHQRIRLLINKGLIKDIGADNQLLLIPTDKAIREFKEIFNCID